MLDAVWGDLGVILGDTTYVLMEFIKHDEIVLHVLPNLLQRDGAAVSAVSVAFRGLVRRTPQLAAVQVVRGREMIREDQDEDGEDSADSADFLRHYYTELGHKGCAEFDGVHVMRARVCLAGERTQAKMVLLQRPKNGTRYNFHEACDAESADLELVGTSFCDSRGRIRLSAVKACGEVMSGGFLYIEQVGEENSAIFEQKDAGAVVIRKLLQDTILRERWSVAVVIPSERELPWFLQAGFVQAKELALEGVGIILFAVPSFLEIPMKSAKEAESTAVLKPKTGSPPSGINKDLLELVKNKGTEAQISNLIKQGASIEASRAIHCCAYNRDMEELEILLRLTSPEKAVNQPDESGLSPLTLAAKAAVGALSKSVLSVPTEVCARLIEARADVSAVDAAGLTALGHMWKALRDARDFDACFGLDCFTVAYDSDELEKLLMPPSGPTSADELMQELSSGSEREEEEEEEEDFDDEDDF